MTNHLSQAQKMCVAFTLIINLIKERNNYLSLRKLRNREEEREN